MTGKGFGSLWGESAFPKGLQDFRIEGPDPRYNTTGISTQKQSPWANAFQQQKPDYSDIMKKLLGQMNQPTRMYGMGVGAPQVNSGPIWNQQQIQQQVNAQRGQNDQGAATQIANMQGQVAGRGFGTGSPLAQALGSMFQMGNMGQNADTERQIRWDTAQGNAQHIQRGQIANAESAVGAGANAARMAGVQAEADNAQRNSYLNALLQMMR